MTNADFSQLSEDYRRIEKAIAFLEENFKSRPGLDRIAAHVHLSKFHFDRLFRRWAGISPMRFMQYLTLDYTKERLAASANVMDAAFDAGLSGPARLHDLFVTLEAVTPGEFKKTGAGLTITFGFHPTPFGRCLIAVTKRGICHLGFVGETSDNKALDQLRNAWPAARLVQGNNHTRSVISQIFAPAQPGEPRPFHLLLKGTNFQVNVWRALLTIPPGSVVSYQQVAVHLGHPKAFRAVANAIALNPVGYLIPCHRVIAKSGKTHQYRWGALRKKSILAREAAGMG